MSETQDRKRTEMILAPHGSCLDIRYAAKLRSRSFRVESRRQMMNPDLRRPVNQRDLMRPNPQLIYHHLPFYWEGALGATVPEFSARAFILLDIGAMVRV